jgi:hypothetical protein
MTMTMDTAMDTGMAQRGGSWPGCGHSYDTL